MTISFIYLHLGAEYDVTATFTTCKFAASMSGPYDDEPTLEDIEVIGPDGMDCAGEMKDIFTRRKPSINPLKPEIVSILDLIEELAFEIYQMEGAA